VNLATRFGCRGVVGKSNKEYGLIKSKVLLIEDQELAQVAAVNALGVLNCGVDVAASGQSALALCQDNQYKCILLDLGLPDTDVKTIVPRIRRSQGDKVPIIAVTAYASTILEEQCRKVGMNDFIEKPLTEDKVYNHLHHYLKKRFILF